MFIYQEDNGPGLYEITLWEKNSVNIYSVRIENLAKYNFFSKEKGESEVKFNKRRKSILNNIKDKTNLRISSGDNEYFFEKNKYCFGKYSDINDNKNSVYFCGLYQPTRDSKAYYVTFYFINYERRFIRKQTCLFRKAGDKDKTLFKRLLIDDDGHDSKTTSPVSILTLHEDSEEFQRIY